MLQNHYLIATKEELKPAANGTFLSLDTYITAAKV